MPITVTDRAAREVEAILGAEGKPGAMLRVWVAGAGCGGLRYGMGIDEKEPEKDDAVFESNGVRVVVDPQSLACMDGSTVTWIEDPENGGFSIENPNPPPSGGCGCGDAGCGPAGSSCCGGD